MKTVNILLTVLAMIGVLISEAKTEDKIFLCIFLSIIIGFWVSLSRYEKSHKIN